jgi:RING finger/CHY zinc finger protein 1
MLSTIIERVYNIKNIINIYYNYIYSSLSHIIFGNNQNNINNSIDNNVTINNQKKNYDIEKELEDFNNMFIGDIIYNCGHYIRGCKYVSPCCNQIFDCRLCHDANFENDINNNHIMNNSDTKQIVCKKCNHMQNFSQYCESCGICFGKYFCDKCKFVDDNENQIYYHCDECGICRRGNKDNYEHCNNCGRCFHVGHKNSCKKKILNEECPICFENLFHSIDTTYPLSCGHTIHTKCLNSSLRSSNGKCPICRKTFARNIMHDKFLKLLVERQPMPDEYKDKKVDILCQDCEQKSNVNFHFIAMFCPNCNSHNTTQI